MADDLFMRKGITKVYFIPAALAPAAVTAAEITAGVELTKSIADISGFTFQNNPFNAPNMDEAFVPQVPGEDTVENSTTTHYDYKDNTTIKDGLAKGDSGYVVFFYSGIAGASPASGDKYEAFPAQVGSNSRVYSAGNEAAQYRVGWTLTGAPVEGTLAA